MKRALPPTYFLGAIILAVAVHFVLPLHQLFHFPWRLIGLLPLLLGILLNLLADQAFKKHDTTVKPFEESTALVTSGVFSFTRNPMYLGMTLILFGVAAMLGSATAFLVVLLLAALLDRVFIIPEEEMLDETFGQQYRQYRGRARRWL
jgi:protein-S-isoprenylcysteine O-methyltransferase Ste14